MCKGLKKRVDYGHFGCIVKKFRNISIHISIRRSHLNYMYGQNCDQTTKKTNATLKIFGAANTIDVYAFATAMLLGPL